ncbi:MAG: hypothetical protein HRT89_02930 [Lentisphaeria bacterium]|nr:SPFH domain-containing protein [Lentisphaeria bacterium]NQZ67003.1 hypothetical protein [Lentisphaeria bacterium]
MKLCKRNLLVLFVMALMMASCRKYEVPEYMEIKTSETAFVVPLEDSSSKGKKLDAAAYDKMKVGAKRIKITKRWDKTGRMWFSGHWIAMIKVIKVDRTAVTREWRAGTANNTKAIWVESSDSINFSMGFNCTAHIEESDAALFLYHYKGDTITSIMDDEIRAEIQTIVADEAAKHDLDLLRAKKGEISLAVRTHVKEYFSKKGITITNIGQVGGFIYEDKKIQVSINEVFIAQQQKAVEKGLLSAMQDREERLKREGTAEGNKIKEVASANAEATKSLKAAEAEGELSLAKAEAEGILLILKSLKEASTVPAFIEVKKLEVESKRIAQWDGRYPQFMMSGGNSPQLLMPMPRVQKSAK